MPSSISDHGMKHNPFLTPTPEQAKYW